MKPQPEYYLQQRWAGKEKWGPPFERMETLDEATRTLKAYRKSVFALRGCEYRLVKMTEVGV